MKIVYIAHPISGDVQLNLYKIKEIGRQINLTEPGVIPFAPYFFDCHALDDSVLEERERGMQNNREYFHRGLIDEVRLYGDRISHGMMIEIRLAFFYKIPVIPMDDEMSKKYDIFKVTSRDNFSPYLK